MRYWLDRVKFFTTIFVACAIALLPLAAQASLTKNSKVVITGIDGIRAGMTIAQAERAAQIVLVDTSPGSRAGISTCYFVEPQNNKLDIQFMVRSDGTTVNMIKNRDRIARVDIFQGSPIATQSGAKIGDSEDRIKSLYPGRISVSPHAYTGFRGGHYLTYTPKDASDRNYRLIFETLNGRVTQFRSGQLPEVEMIEGCA